MLGKTLVWTIGAGGLECWETNLTLFRVCDICQPQHRTISTNEPSIRIQQTKRISWIFFLLFYIGVNFLPPVMSKNCWSDKQLNKSLLQSDITHSLTTFWRIWNYCSMLQCCRILLLSVNIDTMRQGESFGSLPGVLFIKILQFMQGYWQSLCFIVL